MAIIGGLLIGLATSINLLLMGRITGMSSIAFSLLRAVVDSSAKWKYSFFTGLVGISYMTYRLCPSGFLPGTEYRIFDTEEASYKGQSVLAFAVGGFLVGVGVKLGNGCTSGHAVCGIPRLSIRSLLATIMFMTFGVLLGTLRYYYPFFHSTEDFGPQFLHYFRIAADYTILFIVVSYIIIVIYTLTTANGVAAKIDPIISLLVGIIFGGGLTLSGMNRGTKIRGFLSIKENWDPSLIFVMVAALGFNLIAFQLILRKTKKPVMEKKYGLPTNNKLDWKIVVGPAIFGCGWGISGFCPGPAMVNLFIMTHMLCFVPALAAGILSVYYITTYRDAKAKVA